MRREHGLLVFDSKQEENRKIGLGGVKDIFILKRKLKDSSCKAYTKVIE